MNGRNLESTPILDYESPAVRRLADSIHPGGESALDFLRAAHAAISQRISPIYTVEERQPVSKTVGKERGSCSQRLACLEAIARSRGIGTRVRALWVAGKFWNSRFPLSRVFIPERILLAWPQFAADKSWYGVEDIYGAIEQRAESAPAP